MATSLLCGTLASAAAAPVAQLVESRRFRGVVGSMPIWMECDYTFVGRAASFLLQFPISNDTIHHVSIPLEQLSLLCAWMKAEGLVRVKCGTVELELCRQTAPQLRVEQPLPEAKTADRLHAELEELLFASSGG